jgi:hypothetical protein
MRVQPLLQDLVKPRGVEFAVGGEIVANVQMAISSEQSRLIEKAKWFCAKPPCAMPRKSCLRKGQADSLHYVARDTGVLTPEESARAGSGDEGQGVERGGTDAVEDDSLDVARR